MSLEPLASLLQNALGIEVAFAEDCIGEETRALCGLKEKAHVEERGEDEDDRSENENEDEDQVEQGTRVVLLENLMLHAEAQSDLMHNGSLVSTEEQIREFTSQVASLADIWITDAFELTDRSWPLVSSLDSQEKDSTEGRALVAGLAMQHKLAALSRAFDIPEKPMLVIMGGDEVFKKKLSCSC